MTVPKEIVAVILANAGCTVTTDPMACATALKSHQWARFISRRTAKFLEDFDLLWPHRLSERPTLFKLKDGLPYSDESTVLRFTKKAMEQPT